MMKLVLKLLLFLGIVFTGTYAASPLWLSYIFARQLPPDWQLEAFEADYPGPSGIHVNSLRVSGELHAADIAVTATDLRFSYQGLNTDIDSISLDVHMLSSEDRSDDSLTMDDLSFPVTNLTGQMPQLAVSQMRLALHHTTDLKSEAIKSTPPLVLNLESLRLVPRTDNSFHLATNMSFEEYPQVGGRIEIDSESDLLKVEVQFPASIESPPWLAILVEQKAQDMQTSTHIEAVFDAEHANREWLDSILVRGSGGWLKHVNGKLDLQAEFTGKNQQNQTVQNQRSQKIGRFSLSSEKLQLVADRGTLNLKGQLQASRDGEIIIVELPASAEIHYRDETGRIDQLLTSAIPEFQRAPRTETDVFSELDSGSRFVIRPGSDPSINYSGNISFDLRSGGEVLKLHADKFQLNMKDFPRLESVTADGLIKIQLEEHTAVTYQSENMELSADMIIISAEMTVHGRKLISTGVATLTGGRIPNPVTSAAIINMTWRELDLQNMTGNLSTQTLGFSTELNGETWTDFDFDVNYDLLNDSDINGSGSITFKSGLQLPIEYSGNAKTNKWDIKLPSTTIKLAQLADLLDVGHLELPDSARLTDGYISLQGIVMVDDEITAKMSINGYETDASLLESSASDASFSFNAHYNQTVSLSGPVSIEAIALAGGIDVTQIKLDLALEGTDIIDLQNLYAEVFEGQINLGSLRFTNHRLEDTTVELSHISLASLLALADIDGLDGTGILDISLPAGSDQTGLYIKGGTFKSSGPGRLAYTNQGIAGSNIGLQALENFHYQDLSGVINYKSDGNYQIKIRLEGSNPDLYEGYPIVFNLNIGGSLPELFEALFITGNFEEAVLKEIKNQ